MDNDRAISLQDWKSWNGEYTVLPLALKARAELPEDWRGLWSAAGAEPAFVLESGKGGRYTMAGCRPAETIRGKGDRAEATNRDGVVVRRMQGAPMPVMREWLGRWRRPAHESLPPFAGGCVGYWSYDTARSLERLPELAADDLEWPDFSFQLVDRCWVYDHEAREVHAIGCALAERPLGDAELETLYAGMTNELEEMLRTWERFAAIGASGDAAARRKRFAEIPEAERLRLDWDRLQLSSPFDRERFMHAVRRIQSYIAQGDVFQVNLSLRMGKPLSVPPEEVYEWLRLLNPSPYMGYLKFSDLVLASASPELLIKMNDGRVSTRPIAGTRRRGTNAAEDREMREELLLSEKERAEHIMLVDLERNDIGRISEYGSVRVDELMTVEYYSHVMHIVSEVSGTLAAGKDAFDVLAAVFPGGTITGAPKIRTMEIIEELEPVRRGPYTGSFGWIDYSGDMEFNIIIRTLAVRDGIGYVQAGAGIVIDSDPAREYMESMNKAKAVWKAIQYAEASNGRLAR